MSCYRLEREGIVLTVRVTPRAARDAIDGVKTLADGREVAAVRVRAVAEKGGANDAVVTTLARALDRPRSAVTVIAGATGRIKQVRVGGNSAVLTAIVQSWPRL